MRNFCIFCGQKLINDECACSEYQAYFGAKAPAENKHFCGKCGKELFGDQTCDCQKTVDVLATEPLTCVIETSVEGVTPPVKEEPAPRLIDTMHTPKPQNPPSTSSHFQQAGDL